MFYVYNKYNNLVISKLNYEPIITSESYVCINSDVIKDFVICDGIDTTSNLPIIKKLKYNNGTFYYE